MGSYWKCVDTKWDPQHEDPLVVEATNRIIAEDGEFSHVETHTMVMEFDFEFNTEKK